MKRLTGQLLKLSLYITVVRWLITEILRKWKFLQSRLQRRYTGGLLATSAYVATILGCFSFNVFPGRTPPDPPTRGRLPLPPPPPNFVRRLLLPSLPLLVGRVSRPPLRPAQPSSICLFLWGVGGGGSRHVGECVKNMSEIKAAVGGMLRRCYDYVMIMS